MKSKCIDGRPHEWWCYLENGIEYQVCRKLGCNAIRVHPLEHYRPTYGDSRKDLGISHFEEVRGG